MSTLGAILFITIIFSPLFYVVLLAAKVEIWIRVFWAVLLAFIAGVLIHG